MHWVSHCEFRMKSWRWSTKPDKWWFLFRALTASSRCCTDRAPRQSKPIRSGCLGLAHAPSSAGQLKGLFFCIFPPWFRPLNQCRALYEHGMVLLPSLALVAGFDVEVHTNTLLFKKYFTFYPSPLGFAQKWLVSDSLIAFVNELVTVQSLIAICISLHQTTIQLGWSD